MSINYSIIIPHKNIPNLLQKCLDSIPVRDDVQVIVVDDNSDPAIVDFNHFPGLNQKNVEVYFTKKGKGAGYARNEGMKHAKGKWLVFADADDRFNDCLNDAMDQYIDCDYDVVFFKATSASYSDIIDTSGAEHVNNSIDDYLAGKHENLLYKVTCPWSKFISREFINANKIKFSETIWSNDVIFVTKVAILSVKRAVSQMPIYCYYFRDGSLWNTKHRSTKELQVRLKVSVHQIFLFRINDIKQYNYDTMPSYWKQLYDKSHIIALLFLPVVLIRCGYSNMKRCLK